MCGTSPGSASVTVTSKREYRSFTHATVSAHVSSSISHGVTIVGDCTIDDVDSRASLSPGRSTAPSRFRKIVRESARPEGDNEAPPPRGGDGGAGGTIA